jgi:uncharacterized membrane protein
MTNREAIIKSLIWRFLIAIPLSMIVTFLYVGSLDIAVKVTVVANILSTILYYLFDMMWFNYFKNTKCKKQTQKV